MRSHVLNSWILGVGMVAAVASLPGCERQQNEDASPFAEQEYDYILLIVVDMSGSYAELMTADNGRAYQFMLRVVDRFFRNSIGSKDKIIIGQISRNSRAVVWDGSPRQLRQEFANPEAFRTFLVKNSDPRGSRVYDSIADGIDHLMGYPGVVTRKTKSAVFIFSDMDDNFPESEKSRAKLQLSLEKYAQASGVMGLYWVDQALVPEWRRNLSLAAFRSFVVEADPVRDPPLPNFE